MARQLESLRDNIDVKDHLVKYLGHRTAGARWQNQYEEAAYRYLADSTDTSLFGVLVRDVKPKDSDLRNRAKTLASGCPEQTSIELTAIYLPENSISGIGNRTILNKEG